MAQPNVVREPSMDEILASIRRIIESNEPVNPSTGEAESYGFNGQPANDDAEEVTLTIDDTFSGNLDYSDENDGYIAANQASDERIEAPAPVAVARAREMPAQPAKPLSLADVAARVRAASERSTELRMSGQSADVSHSGGPEIRSVEAPRAEPVAMPASVQSVSPPDYHRHDNAVATGPVEDNVQAAPVEDVVQIAEPVSDESSAATEPSAQSLISSTVGQKVARSFQDLATALDEANRRSIDEIAEEMLRPMLQEWLDDNLPTLVERLVREEIERVARGPRR